MAEREREYVPCPTCLGGANNVAEVVPPRRPGDFPRGRCVSGQHECSLTPAVLDHLRQIRDLAERRAG